MENVTPKNHRKARNWNEGDVGEFTISGGLWKIRRKRFIWEIEEPGENVSQIADTLKTSRHVRYLLREAKDFSWVEGGERTKQRYRRGASRWL